MAKGARNSVRKTNNRVLKAKVFGPVETARAERLNAKLMELVSQPKPAREEMEVEQTDDAAKAKKADAESTSTAAAGETAMEVDGAKLPRSSWIKAEKRAKEEKRAAIDKKRIRKPRNKMSFTKPRGPKRK
ncbi:hypothetical protein AAFC00_002892 [Neodothiora populina]|uniref:DUF2423 domain-containing protein n=1 Tax=Neodothiora populina TaxID=2781224 RepID=A0ABR3P8L5_9PEZI